MLETLEKLGFKKASENIRSKRELAKKMHIAYQKYEFVTQETVDSFNAELKKRTLKNYQYDKLVFTNVSEYPDAPPAEALGMLEKAVEEKCFDYFEIGKIEAQQEYPDPILFGRINGCGDRFFIAQWDSDVTVEEIQKYAQKQLA
jgi:hypothetical protein